MAHWSGAGAGKFLECLALDGDRVLKPRGAALALGKSKGRAAGSILRRRRVALALG
jgi:hypothetical protein